MKIAATFLFAEIFREKLDLPKHQFMELKRKRLEVKLLAPKLLRLIEKRLLQELSRQSC